MNNKKKIKNIIIKLLKFILVIVWMIIVFKFSAQVREDSSNLSGNTIRKIITFFNPEITLDKLEVIVNILQPWIRKLAHLTLYAIGGFLIYNLNKEFIRYNTKRNIGTSLAIGTIYAISDEIHQFFVPGRACRGYDVLIDALGCFIGILIYIIIEKICIYLKNKIIDKKKTV